MIPVVATEQHGRNLPLSVDTDWAVAVAEISLALHWAGEHVDIDQTAVPSQSNTPPATSDFDYPVELDPALNGNAVSRFLTPDAHRLATGPAGSVGDPRPASAAKGRAMVDAVATNLVRLIDQLRAAEVGETCAGIPCRTRWVIGRQTVSVADALVPRATRAFEGVFDSIGRPRFSALCPIGVSDRVAAHDQSDTHAGKCPAS